jgi:hypothetical protein
VSYSVRPRQNCSKLIPTPNQTLHLTAAANSVFRVQRLTGCRGR